MQEEDFTSKGSHSNFSPFIVFGSSKSGTTWLQRLLDSHPQIRCHFQVPIFPLKDSELWLKWRRLRVRRESPFGGVFNNEVEEERYQRVHDVLYNLEFLQPSFYEEISNDLPQEIRKEIELAYLRIVRGIAKGILIDDGDKEIFGTKSYTNLDLFFRVFPFGKVIHIVRDGRDICVSKRFHFLRMGIYFPGEERSKILRFMNKFYLTYRTVRYLQHHHGWFDERWFITPGKNAPLFTEEALTKMATEWKLITEYILKFQKKYPESFLTVRYEELKERGNEILREACMFLGVNSDSNLIQNIFDKNAFEKIKGSEENSFFRKGIAGDWRNYFSHKDVITFNEVAGGLLRELGYEVTES